METETPTKISEHAPGLRRLQHAADSGATTDEPVDASQLAKMLFESRDDLPSTQPCPECDHRGVCGRQGGRDLWCDCKHGHRKHRQHYDHIHERFDHAGVPGRLRYVTLETLAEKSGRGVMRGEAVRAVRDLMEQGYTRDPQFDTRRRGLCILGRNGPGKTGLLVILARRAYRQGRTPLFIKYSDLVKGGIQAGYGVRTDQGVELSHIRLRTAQTAQCLCLDDLGDPFGEAGRYSEPKDRRDLIFQILAARHERGLLTHVTANYDSLKAIGQQFDPRIADRIKEMCAVVQMEGPNLREVPN